MIPLRLHLRSCQCLCQLGLIKNMLVAWKEGANGEGGGRMQEQWEGTTVKKNGRVY